MARVTQISTASRRITSQEVCMAFTEIPAHCHDCQLSRPFRRHNANHLLHLLLTVLLGGLWLPVWLLAAVYRGPFRCSSCGAKYVRPPRPISAYLVPFVLVAGLLLLVGLYPA